MLQAARRKISFCSGVIWKIDFRRGYKFKIKDERITLKNHFECTTMYKKKKWRSFQISEFQSTKLLSHIACVIIQIISNEFCCSSSLLLRSLLSLTSDDDEEVEAIWKLKRMTFLVRL